MLSLSSSAPRTPDDTPNAPAIVLIYGVGEQAQCTRYVHSLQRRLVMSQVKSAGAKQARSSPESYELRRLVADGTRSRPTIDFFEYYWAHRMEGNRIGHVWPLARVLMLRWPWNFLYRC